MCKARQHVEQDGLPELTCQNIEVYDLPASLGAIHKLCQTNFMIFLPLPVLVTGGHISDVTYFANFTARNY